MLSPGLKMPVIALPNAKRRKINSITEIIMVPACNPHPQQKELGSFIISKSSNKIAKQN